MYKQILRFIEGRELRLPIWVARQGGRVLLTIEVCLGGGAAEIEAGVCSPEDRG